MDYPHALTPEQKKIHFGRISLVIDNKIIKVLSTRQCKTVLPMSGYQGEKVTAEMKQNNIFLAECFPHTRGRSRESNFLWWGYRVFLAYAEFPIFCRLLIYFNGNLLFLAVLNPLSCLNSSKVPEYVFEERSGKSELFESMQKQAKECKAPADRCLAQVLSKLYKSAI